MEMRAASRERLRSKRAQHRRFSVVVERAASVPPLVFFALTAVITKLDTRIHASHTAHTPFQILLSESADAHPCRRR
jgi:hypothetical protein